MIKKILVVMLLLILTSTVMGTSKSETKLITAQNEWVVVNDTTSDGNEPTDLAVGERTYLTVKAAIAAAVSVSEGDGEISIYRIPYEYNAGRFRCIGTTNNSTVTYQVYAGTLGNGTDCELANIGQLAFTVGQQVSTVSTYEMADTLTVTSYCSTKSWSTATPASDLVAETVIDLQGADILVVVTTTSECNSKLLMTGY